MGKQGKDESDNLDADLPRSIAPAWRDSQPRVSTCGLLTDPDGQAAGMGSYVRLETLQRSAVLVRILVEHLFAMATAEIHRPA